MGRDEQNSTKKAFLTPEVGHRGFIYATFGPRRKPHELMGLRAGPGKKACLACLAGWRITVDVDWTFRRDMIIDTFSQPYNDA